METSLRACFKNRPVRGPGLQWDQKRRVCVRARAFRRRSRGFLKHALRICVGKNDRVKGLILDGGGDTVFNQSGRRPFWFLFAWQMKWKSFEAFAISPESVTGNPFLGSTGQWPVPHGDSPGGTGSAQRSKSDRGFESGRF